jgi:hypothetical protein
MTRPRRKVFKMADLGRNVGLAQLGADPYRKRSLFLLARKPKKPGNRQQRKVPNERPERPGVFN